MTLVHNIAIKHVVSSFAHVCCVGAQAFFVALAHCA